LIYFHGNIGRTAPSHDLICDCMVRE